MNDGRTDYRLVQVDAFASAPFTGNPAAVMPLDHWLDDAVLQSIALENNLSETAFLVRDASGAADYELRWFTPAVEVALCGHATLASGHVLLGDDPARRAVTFRTRKAGVLRVTRDAAGGYAMALPAFVTEPRPLPDLAAAIGGPVQETRWHGQRYALFVYPDAATVRALDPDFRAMRAHGDILSIATAPGDGGGTGSGTDVISRVFAPGGGIDEDPVTGSAHCVLTPYWTARLGRPSFTAYQASARGGHVGCRIDGDSAILSGNAVTVLNGVMRV